MGAPNHITAFIKSKYPQGKGRETRTRLHRKWTGEKRRERRAVCHMKGIGAAEWTVTEHPGLSQESVNMSQKKCEYFTAKTD